MDKDMENFAERVSDISAVLEGLEAANQVALDALIMAMLAINPHVIPAMRGLIARREREVAGSVADAGKYATVSYANRIAEVYALLDKVEQAAFEGEAQKGGDKT